MRGGLRVCLHNTKCNGGRACFCYLHFWQQPRQWPIFKEKEAASSMEQATALFKSSSSISPATSPWAQTAPLTYGSTELSFKILAWGKSRQTRDTTSSISRQIKAE